MINSSSIERSRFFPFSSKQVGLGAVIKHHVVTLNVGLGHVRCEEPISTRLLARSLACRPCGVCHLLVFTDGAS